MDFEDRTEIYERCQNLPERAGDARLKTYEWYFLMALDGRKTAGEVAAEVRLDPSRLSETVRRLREHGLIEIPELTWKEFVGRYPVVAGPLPRIEGQFPVGPLPDAPSIAAPLPEGPIGPSKTETAEPSAAVAFSIRRPPAPAKLPDGSTHQNATYDEGDQPLNLKRLIDYVTEHAGGGLHGKLAVYRMFLRVPNEQIRAAGIQSLNFVDDQFEIRDPAMRNSIFDAVLAVTGQPYPGA